ncbi:tetratricopeptide repeat-containing sensor histidine kinase [Nibrella viscosa]
MHRSCWYPFFLLLALSHFGQGQVVARRDSLLRIYEQSNTDSVRVQVLLDISKLYASFADARPWIDKAMLLSRTANYQLGIANCLTNYNRYLYTEGRYEEVKRNCEEGLRIAVPLKAHRTIGVLYNTLANLYHEQGQEQQALSMYLKALDEINQAEVPAFFPIAIESNIANLYNALRQPQKALDIGLRCLERAEKAGAEGQMAYTSQQIAEAYHALNDSDKSRYYWQKCLTIARRVDNPVLVATALSNLGGLAADAGSRGQALAYYQRSLALARTTRNPQIEMWNLHGIAIERFEQRQWQAAYDLGQKARQIAEAQKYTDYLAEIYRLLADIEIARGNLQEGEKWGRQWKEIRNALVNETVLRATQELETKYQTRQKNARILALEQQRQIQELSLRQKNGLIYGLTGLLGLLGVIGVLYYRNFRHRQQLAEQENQLNIQLIRQLEQEKQLSAAEGLLRGQEEERGRLARDLHDGLGGMLSGIKSSLTAMSGNQILPESSVSAFNRVIDNLETSIQELRRVARNMMPEALVRFGLKDALQDYIDYLNRSGGQSVDYQTFGLEERLPQSTEIIVFRLVQELLNNVQKHAHADQALVQLIRDGERFHLTVEDNGQGFDPDRLAEQRGIGWLNIRSRVDYLNGTLDVVSAPGRGTSVNVEFMLTAYR